VISQKIKPFLYTPDKGLVRVLFQPQFNGRKILISISGVSISNGNTEFYY